MLLVDDCGVLESLPRRGISVYRADALGEKDAGLILGDI